MVRSSLRMLSWSRHIVSLRRRMLSWVRLIGWQAGCVFFVKAVKIANRSGAEL